MTDINPSPSWAAVRQLEIGEFALGGTNGNINEQAKSLAARSEFLKQHAAYQYNTLAEANADIANIALNQNVNVVDSGLYKKATAGATSLTKSAFDPLNQAKDAIPQNLLFDPFNETVDADKSDSLQGYKNAEFTSKLTSSANAYFGKPTLQGAGSTRVARYIDVKKLGLDVGATFYARVKAYFNGVDGTSRITVASYKADGTVLQNTLKLPITGVNDIVSDVITITSDTAYIGVLLPSATDKELIAVSFSTLNKPKFIYGATPSSVSKSINSSIVSVASTAAANTAAIAANTAAIANASINLMPDPFFRLYKQGITVGDYPLFNESTWSVVDYAASPFASKIALSCTGAQKHRNIKLDRLGLKVGDVLSVKIGMTLVDGGVFGIGVFVRDASNAVIGSAVNVRPTLVENTYTEITNSITITQAMLDTGAYLQIRFNVDSTVFANGYYVCAEAIYINSPNNKIRDTSYAEDEIRKSIKSIDNYLNEVPYTYGGHLLRETRQRTRKRLLGEDKQYTIANVGDSWSHNRDRWVGSVANELFAKFGDAGGGWVGFGFQTDNTALFNGNIRTTYGYTWDIGSWTGNYGFSHSPDICQADSDIVGAKITCTSPSTGPNVSGVDLFYIGGSGVIRYQFNGGAWTTFNLNATTSGDLGVTALNGFAALNNTLEIEVVSGSVGLCGINWKSNANGVVWHKTGASGSLASRWAGSDKPNWTRGLLALKPDLVTIMHGTNDQIAGKTTANFTNSLTVIVDNIRSVLPDADILIVAPCINGRDAEFPVTMLEYTKVAYNVARYKGCAFLDLQKVFGDSFSQYASGSARNWFHEDKIHPRPETGGRVIVDAIYRFIMYGT